MGTPPQPREPSPPSASSPAAYTGCAVEFELQINRVSVFNNVPYLVYACLRIATFYPTFMTEPNAIAPALSSAGRVPRAGRSRGLLPLACAAHHLHSCSVFLSLSQGAGQSTPVLLSPPVLDENSSLRPDLGECRTIPCFPLRPLGLAWGNVHLSQMLGFLSG